MRACVRVCETSQRGRVVASPEARRTPWSTEKADRRAEHRRRRGTGPARRLREARGGQPGRWGRGGRGACSPGRHCAGGLPTGPRPTPCPPGLRCAVSAGVPAPPLGSRRCLSTGTATAALPCQHRGLPSAQCTAPQGTRGHKQAARPPRGRPLGLRPGQARQPRPADRPLLAEPGRHRALRAGSCRSRRAAAVTQTALPADEAALPPGCLQGPPSAASRRLISGRHSMSLRAVSSVGPLGFRRLWAHTCQETGKFPASASSDTPRSRLPPSRDPLRWPSRGLVPSDRLLSTSLSGSSLRPAAHAARGPPFACHAVQAHGASPGLWRSPPSLSVEGPQSRLANCTLSPACSLSSLSDPWPALGASRAFRYAPDTQSLTLGSLHPRPSGRRPPVSGALAPGPCRQRGASRAPHGPTDTRTLEAGVPHCSVGGWGAAGNSDLLGGLGWTPARAATRARGQGESWAFLGAARALRGLSPHPWPEGSTKEAWGARPQAFLQLRVHAGHPLPRFQGPHCAGPGQSSASWVGMELIPEARPEVEGLSEKQPSTHQMFPFCGPRGPG